MRGSKLKICSGKSVKWVETFVGILLPGAVKKMMAKGKTPTDVASFSVSQEGEDLFVDV
ncbi:MAG: hypothetical protein AAFQ63_22580 [Cyanobacteria bacterium J06621_11]